MFFNSFDLNALRLHQTTVLKNDSHCLRDVCILYIYIPYQKMTETKQQQPTTPVIGAHFMRVRDTYVVYVFDSVRRQKVVDQRIVRTWNDFDKAFPGAFQNTRALHRFIVQVPSRRKRRGNIADRMDIQIVRMDIPVWVPRSKKRCVHDLEEKKQDD